MTEVRVLDEPADGVPPVLTTQAELDDACRRLSGGSGPVAVDAERASGYRYGQRAYLVQLRRHQAGTFLFDPIALGDLSPIAQALGDTEWVLHAANQDLPCLDEIGLRPGGDLFDTELGGRLAGLDRVGLGTMVAQLLGWQLAKEHSAADWSKRPLPADWLRYAALDVEVLVELRDAVESLLVEQDKLPWAHEEFAAVRDARPKPPREDPWRRTSGVHSLRSRRQLAVLRELWRERDALAQRRDLAPGRLLPDKAIVNAARELPTTQAALIALPVFSGPANRRQAGRWLAAITRGMKLPDPQLPPMSVPNDSPPPPRAWPDRDPQAAARLAAARGLVTERAEALNLPAENLITPEFIRRLCWSPPERITGETVADTLTQLGARAWQVAQLADDLAAAIASADTTSAEA
ncbi:MAG: HRDC domain-containing protein [Actinomycetales bacterium]